jgi:COP9 signalosome complex subunit 6
VRTIYKSPQLDLVGWYTLLPKTGPNASILPIHSWLLSEYNESSFSLLLAFHPEEALDQSAGSKLPLTIYEGNYEVDEPKADQSGEDREMKDGDAPLKLKFRELPYSVETGEAEMISMDFVARGGGNATLIKPAEPTKPKNVLQEVELSSNAKGKQRASDTEKNKQSTTPAPNEHVLSREDEELIAALTTKANAIKMLQARIKLLITYLERLPHSSLTDAKTPNAADQKKDAHTTPSHTILRSIQALVNRLALLVPPATAVFDQELLSEANDMFLVSLLNNVTQSAISIRDIGKKHYAVDSAKKQARGNAPNIGNFDGLGFSGATALDL